MTDASMSVTTRFNWPRTGRQLATQQLNTGPSSLAEWTYLPGYLEALSTSGRRDKPVDDVSSDHWLTELYRA